MKTLAVLLLALMLASPAVAARAAALAYAKQPTIFLNKTQTVPQMSARALIKYNASFSKHGFVGLGGVYGSVAPQDEEYVPATLFGKPRPKAVAGPKLPEYYVSVGGIANATPGVSVDPCAQFQCKPGENVVANMASKKYYRCHCAAAKNIDPSIRKCFDTPRIAEKIGLTPGTC
jgi:hypothetical protein